MGMLPIPGKWLNHGPIWELVIRLIERNGEGNLGVIVTKREIRM